MASARRPTRINSVNSRLSNFLVFHTEGLYHQLYDAITTASVLVGRIAEPPLRVVSLAKLKERAEGDARHPLAHRLRHIAGAVDLLTWLCELRHKGLQHRAENRYTGNRGIVESDAVTETPECCAFRPLPRVRSIGCRGCCGGHSCWARRLRSYPAVARTAAEETAGRTSSSRRRTAAVQHRRARGPARAGAVKARAKTRGRN
jgi:hypothetical protein